MLSALHRGWYTLARSGGPADAGEPHAAMIGLSYATVPCEFSTARVERVGEPGQAGARRLGPGVSKHAAAVPTLVRPRSERRVHKRKREAGVTRVLLNV